MTLILQVHTETFTCRIVAEPRSSRVSLFICPSVTDLTLNSCHQTSRAVVYRQHVQLIIPLEPSADAALSGVTV